MPPRALDLDNSILFADTGGTDAPPPDETTGSAGDPAGLGESGAGADAGLDGVGDPGGDVDGAGSGADAGLDGGGDLGEGDGDATGGDEGEEEPGKTAERTSVPVAALKAEREKRQALETELIEQRGKVDLLWKSLQDFQQQMSPPKGEEPAAPAKPDFPDPKDDPIGHLVAKNDWLEQQVLTLQDKATGYEKGEQAKTERVTAESNARHAIAAAEQALRAEVPDYDDALKHLRAVQVAQIRQWGAINGMNEAQIMQEHQRQEAAAAMAVVAKGGDPARYAYEMANLVGYRPVDPAKPNGKTEMTPEKKAEVQNRAAKAASLGSGGSDAGNDDGDQQGSRMSIPQLQTALGEAFGEWRKSRGH